MSEALENFQTMAGQCCPAVPAALGFVCLWLGLCIWLGGLRWLKAVAALTAAAAGFAAAWVLTDRTIIPVVLFPVLAGAAAIFIDKLIGVLLAASLIAIIVLSILAAHALAGPQLWENPPPIGPAQIVDVPQSLSILAQQARFFAGGFYQAFVGLAALLPAAGAIVILAVAGIGLLWPEGICSVGCAILGTAGVGLGLLFLLIFKGAKPVDYLISHTTLLAATAAAMIVFGTIAGLALCYVPAKTPPKKTPSKESR